MTSSSSGCKCQHLIYKLEVVLQRESRESLSCDTRVELEIEILLLNRGKVKINLFPPPNSFLFLFFFSFLSFPRPSFLPSFLPPLPSPSFHSFLLFSLPFLPPYFSPFITCDVSIPGLCSLRRWSVVTTSTHLSTSICRNSTHSAKYIPEASVWRL